MLLYEGLRQFVRFEIRKLVDGRRLHSAPAAVMRRAGGRQQRAEGRIDRAFLGPVAADEEHRRDFVAEDQVGDKRRTVRVGPLQVVDHHDQWLPIDEAREQIAEGGATLAPLFVYVRSLDRSRRNVGHCVNPAQDRKQARQSGGIVREERFGLR